MRARRFSQAISEGDGISVIAAVDDVDAARTAEAGGAEGVLVRARLDGMREATSLPVLHRSATSPQEASEAGADACILVAERLADDGAHLARLHAEALELGLDCVVEVSDDEELELALERIDPEIMLHSAPEADPRSEEALDYVLELLPDVPAGMLAV